jgi:hypothetical protein
LGTDFLPPKRTLPLYGLGLDVAQALHKSKGALAIEQPGVGQIPNGWQLRRLLRARRERPRGSRAAAKQDDEIAPSYT